MTIAAGLDHVVECCRMALEIERSREAAMIADVIANHGPMPNNYWQARWRAEQRLKAALAIRAAFEGES